MEPAAKPLFQSRVLPAPTTTADQYLAAILAELCAIRELLVAQLEQLKTLRRKP